ncbi:putative RNA-binding protein with PIN domain [Kroppenstedtia sanguinis]|uniref:NYN domain-containing protein n=1 Tax=Kroppenstedtia sanguinis TaxID=1380684 RepID=A0ABW4CDQ9_9BACL
MKDLEEWLIVDGYNVIGAHEEWSRLPLEEARHQLATLLSEYQATSERRVFLVFDAHRIPGAGSRHSEQQITIYYTKEHETADQMIERLVKQHRKSGRRIYVATSDYLEQRIVFGQGAYRLSSRELLEEFRRMKGNISSELKGAYESKNTLGQGLGEEILKTLENWRRKK